MSQSPGESDPASARLPTAGLPAVARDLAVAQLSEAYANDLISLDELERRIAKAFAAADPAELATLTSDLPRSAEPERPAARTAVSVPAQRLSAVFSSIERSGFVDMPRRFELRVFAGNIELDLSQARFAPGVTDIEIRCVMGNVEIILPPNVLVENYGESFMSSFENQGAGGDSVRDGASILRITGRVILSSVEVGT